MIRFLDIEHDPRVRSEHAIRSSAPIPCFWCGRGGTDDPYRTTTTDHLFPRPTWRRKVLRDTRCVLACQPCNHGRAMIESRLIGMANVREPAGAAYWKLVNAGICLVHPVLDAWMIEWADKGFKPARRNYLRELALTRGWPEFPDRP